MQDSSPIPKTSNGMTHPQTHSSSQPPFAGTTVQKTKHSQPKHHYTKNHLGATKSQYVPHRSETEIPCQRRNTQSLSNSFSKRRTRKNRLRTSGRRSTELKNLHGLGILQLP